MILVELGTATALCFMCCFIICLQPLQYINPAWLCWWSCGRSNINLQSIQDWASMWVSQFWTKLCSMIWKGNTLVNKTKAHSLHDFQKHFKITECISSVVKLSYQRSFFSCNVLGCPNLSCWVLSQFDILRFVTSLVFKLSHFLPFEFSLNCQTPIFKLPLVQSLIRKIGNALYLGH